MGLEEHKSHEADREENDDDNDDVVQKATEFEFAKPALLSVPANSQSNTLSPMVFGGRARELSPKPSPAWKGVFCYPGEEDSVSAIVDVSSIPSQTTTTSPLNSAPPLGSTTPGGGRVLRVKGKLQGVVEKPWILRPKKERKEADGAKKEDKVKRTHGGTSKEKTQAEKERKGVVHIREVDGKLCVVRTVYPSDYGSPVWRGDTELPGEVVKVLNEDMTSTPIGAITIPKLDISAKGTHLETPTGAPQRSPSLLESGYTSDLPLTSPGTTGTTPSQTEWGVPIGSSSERLDSVVESGQSLQQQALPKV